MNDIKEEEKTPQTKKFNWKRFWFWAISLFVIVLFLVIAIPNMIYEKIYRIRESCSGNLRNLGIVVTNYSTDHKGHYPQNLKVLETLGYIEKLPGCFNTGKPYLYTIDGWDDASFTIWCPNPEKHYGYQTNIRCSSLYYAAGSGVNRVEMSIEDSKIEIEKDRKIERKQKNKILFIILGIAFAGGLIYLIILIHYYQQEKRKLSDNVNNQDV